MQAKESWELEKKAHAMREKEWEDKLNELVLAREDARSKVLAEGDCSQRESLRQNQELHDNLLAVLCPSSSCVLL